MENGGVYDNFPRHTKCLWQNRSMIEENVVWNSKLFTQLKSMRVLPETMIKDVIVSQLILVVGFM